MVTDPGTLGVFLTGLTVVLVAAHTLGVVAPGVTSLVVPVPDRLAALASLGLVLLLVMAGTEVDVSAVRRYARPTIAIATGGSVVPFVLGFGLGWTLPASYLVNPDQRFQFALFLATALSISAVPVAVRVLVDLDAMDLRVGQLTLTAAVAIDAAGWVALTVVSDVARQGTVDVPGVGWTVLALLAFVGVVVLIGPGLVERLFAVTTHVRSPVLTGFTIVIVVGFAMAGASLALGLEAVVGAFLAGALVRSGLDEETERVFQMVTLGLFAPLFFATAGLRADLSGLAAPDTLAVATLTLVVAVLGKFIGVALGAAFTDLGRAETLCLAIGLNARGAMEIVVAALGLSIGILSATMYTVVVVVAILTSVMTPPLLRRALTRLPDAASHQVRPSK